MSITKQLLFIFFLFLSINLKAQCWESVSVGYGHNLAIAADGTLWSWGLNHDGELGNGTTVTLINTPTQIGTDTDWNLVSAGLGPTSFSMATKDNGTLWAWGDNGYGQVGDNTFVDKYSPAQVGIDTDWQSMSAGFSHALATKTDGTLWAWGRGTTYALGNGGLVNKENPTQVGFLNNWSSVSAGDRFSMAVKTDGTVLGWGYNNGNPIGINGNPANVTIPTQRSYNNTNAGGTTAGSKHSFDVKTSGLLVFWGSNVYNQSGGTTCAGCPVYYVSDADAGKNTNAIIKTDGTLWYSGVHLGYSQSTVQYATVFTQFGTDSDWSSVSVGNLSGAAIKNDGSMWTWGWNSWGQLGNGVNSQASSSLTLVPLNCPFCIATTSTDNISSCIPITWIDGNTYSSNNTTATHTLVNVGGCDSIITLNLIINTGSNGIDNRNSCDSILWIDGNTYTSNNTTATHILTNGDINGCDSLVTLNLTINTLDTGITLNNHTITSNAVGSTYQWITCDNGNTFLPGETNQNFTATINGSYAVIVTKNSCSDTSACTSIIVTGVNKSKSVFESYEFFPNPTKGKFTLNLKAIDNNTSITVYNVLGEIIIQQAIITPTTILNLSAKSDGIYFIKIQTTSEIRTVKIIKE